jgi:site-specific DNA-methyltransferase (adenine-specific)
MKVTDKITITNEDNMLLMARYPDNYFDLAIVDPPYGIDSKISTTSGLNKGNKFAQLYNEKRWDKFRPENEYFNELLRVSKNQIICGGNYFAEKLPVSRGWIVWDKQGEGVTSVNNELMWTSFDVSIKTFSRCHGLDKGFMAKGTNKVFHPTQKPVALYKWLLDKYAKENDKILDTHLGSGSIAIACHDYGFELTACELDKEYYDKAIERIVNHTNQTKLF